MRLKGNSGLEIFIYFKFMFETKFIGILNNPGFEFYNQSELRGHEMIQFLNPLVISMLIRKVFSG